MMIVKEYCMFGKEVMCGEDLILYVSSMSMHGKSELTSVSQIITVFAGFNHTLSGLSWLY
jgi:hypothetical protein